MGRGLSLLSDIEKEVEHLPKLQCICGSVTIIMKKVMLNTRTHTMRMCRCAPNHRTRNCSNSNEKCFTSNCPAYLDFIKKRFSISWDNLTWALINQDEHLFTKLYATGEEAAKTEILLNSAHPLANMVAD